MRIVILTIIPFANVAVEELIEQLEFDGKEVIALDVFNAKMYKNNKYVNLLPSFFYKKNRILIISRKMLRYIWANYFLYKYVKNSDILNIHFVLPNYYYILKFIKNNIVILSFWGSDLFRLSNRNLRKVSGLIKISHKVSLFSSMREKFNELFPNNEYKVNYIRFGLKKTESFFKISDVSIKNDVRRIFDIPNDRIVIACGYNATKEQQHSIMIKSLTALPHELKSNLFILLPLTYGKDSVYINRLEDELKLSGFEYKLILDRLSDDNLIKMRYVSDIVLNIQTTDALAASLQESLMANNILIVGEWLNYDIYDENQIFYLKTNIDNMSNKLFDVISNINFYVEKCKNNSDRMYAFSSWKYRYAEWRNLYYN